jgi:hypothetical protein
VLPDQARDERQPHRQVREAARALLGTKANPALAGDNRKRQTAFSRAAFVSQKEGWQSHVHAQRLASEAGS